MWSTLWVWISGSMVCLVAGQDCVYQQGCTCFDNSTWCTSLGLVSIPPLVRTGPVDSLYLDWNNITSVPHKSLPPSIQLLSMMYDPVTSIEDSAFDDSANTLASISFSGANFSMLPNAIGHLQTLRGLYIYNTKISDWNSQVMKNISHSVRSLILEGCSIKTWPDWLKYYNNLTQISFAGNLISYIPDGGLDSVADTITSLDLQNNSLTSVPRALYRMSALGSLFLSQNQMTNISWLPTSSRLTLLSLNNNKLSDVNQLSQTLTSFADTLEELYITYNKLTKIPNIDYLTRVFSLDFSYNLISDPISGALPANLSYLGLSFNVIRSIPRVFMTLTNESELFLYDNSLTQITGSQIPPWTAGLEVSYNFITELTDTSFRPNSSLIYINLSNNPLHKISTLAFKNVPQLGEINLQYTKLTRVPLSLMLGKGLTFVDLSFCDNLVCTCEEKGLSKWLGGQPEKILMGSCGRTTIDQFYRSLASDCPT